ncbi:hypothetical protein Pyn_18133 [Prunus yedoensis var. nudiflora]|uniref:Dof-type domain-containing protein n=1 Tax=Prunus yedoensis var. nudiflora TaxID=2094558 RepID=A0A314Y044_PRUYE|nr:hypothetical protein Pyn_18133 [Prunus yedoensis var. nudiflora]
MPKRAFLGLAPPPQCHHCHSTDTEFSHCNNNTVEQPWYTCATIARPLAAEFMTSRFATAISRISPQVTPCSSPFTVTPCSSSSSTFVRLPTLPLPPPHRTALWSNLQIYLDGVWVLPLVALPLPPLSVDTSMSPSTPPLDDSLSLVLSESPPPSPTDDSLSLGPSKNPSPHLPIPPP